MTVIETHGFALSDDDVKKLLGLPKKANVIGFEVTSSAKYPDRFVGFRITARVRVRHRRVGK